MKKIIFLLLIFVASSVFGNEFWIQPEKFIYKRGETINIHFATGENFNEENWDSINEEIQSLRFYFSNVCDSDLAKSLINKKNDSLQLAVLDEGTVMAALDTKPFYTELDGKKFNEYLFENGFIDSIKFRQQNSDTAKSVYEIIHKNLKTILQVGNNTDNSYKQKTYLSLDIIPDDHPYKVTKEEKFKVKIIFQNADLKNTKVKVWHRLKEKLTQADYITDENGELEFLLFPEGEWMISCITLIHSENDPAAEWHTYWGTLTWGYY
jgi:uncharacterized GH25 family protein